MTKLEQIEKQIDDHIAIDCQLCRHAIQRVDAPACPFLLDLNREAREAYRKASPRVRYQAAVTRATREYDSGRAQRWDNSSDSRSFNEIADTY